jgi:hypothetical protein
VETLNLKEESESLFPEDFRAWIDSASKKHDCDLDIFCTDDFAQIPSLN